MKRQVLPLIFVLAIFGVGVTACSGESGSSAIRGKALDRAVLKLQSGMSVDDVRAKLGTPRLERTLGKEEVLYYSLWQLVFEPGLKTRTRVYRAGYRPNIDIKALARKIQKLRLSMSIQDVRARLGVPEALEVIQNPPHEEESLWYGNGRWKLEFAVGRLVKKIKF